MQKSLYRLYTISGIRIIALAILQAAGYKTIAQQKEVTHQTLYWVRYYNQMSVHPRWTWHNEIDNRRFLQVNKQHHLIIHSHLHYKVLPNVDIAAGFTYSRQSPQSPDATVNLVVPELRPFQEINLTMPFGKRLVLAQRLRVDERFIHRNNGKQLLDGYDFNFRIRLRAQAIVLLSKQSTDHTTYLKIANELMVNAGKNITLNQFDQNRIYVGLEQNLGKKLAFELGYLHWYQQRNSGYQFFNRDITRLTIYHRINTKS
ncbi:MAG TPA: hypothetical protein DCR35_16220 [Runella sp.]|nr:hypothetical protein [Runella sp.]HAO50705.1 hypothetical protein [Runella sp.]